MKNLVIILFAQFLFVNTALTQIPQTLNVGSITMCAGVYPMQYFIVNTSGSGSYLYEWYIIDPAQGTGWTRCQSGSILYLHPMGSKFGIEPDIRANGIEVACDVFDASTGDYIGSTSYQNPGIATVQSKPTQPGAFTISTTSLCQGSTGIVYTVPKDTKVTYTWTYSGSGVTIKGSTNNVTVDFGTNSTSGTLSVMATTGSVCPTSAAQSVTINVKPLPLQPSAFTDGKSNVCTGQTGISYIVPLDTSVTYNWTYSGSGVAINGSKSSVSMGFSATASSGTLGVTASNGCGTSTARTFPITVNTLPTYPGAFTASSQSVCQGQNEIIYTVPNDPTVTYNWSYSGTGGTITGSTNSVTLGLSTIATSGILGVVASNSCGTSAAQSIYVTVNPLPIQPGAFTASSQSVCQDQNRVIYTVPNDPTVTYNWSYSGTGGTITGSTNSVTLGLSTTATSGILAVAAKNGCGISNSQAIPVIVFNKIDPGTISSSQTICYNSTPLELTNPTSPTGGPGVYTFQWQYSTNDTFFINIPNATDAIFQPEELTQTTYYRKIIGFDICGTDTTNKVTISVLNKFEHGIIGYTQSICNKTLPDPLTGTSPTGASGIYTFQWQKSLNNTDWENVESATTIGYHPDTLSNSTYFRRVETSGICGTVYSNSVYVNVYPIISSGEISDNQSIIFNTIPNQLMGTTPSGGPGFYNYQWQISTNNLNWNNLIDNGNGQNYQPLNLKKTTYFRRVDKFGRCGIDTSNTIYVTVIKNLTPGSINSDQLICFNSLPGLLTGTNPTGGTGLYTYQWQNSSDNSNWTNINSAQNFNYQPDALIQNTFFRRVTSDVDPDGGSSPSKSVYITLYPKINTPSTDALKHYCQGNNVMINILNPTAQSYTWIYKSSITHGNSFQKTNVTSNAVVYLTANDINGCSSDRDTININIDPIKALFTATTNANVGQSVMFSNTSINATFYQWNFFDGSTSTEQSPSHIYNQTGTKNVFLKVISSLGCADSLLRSNYITILNGTGIEESKNIEFKIYPIPIKDVLNINFAEQIEKVSIEIFDSNGIKLVKTKAKGKVTINFPYPSGFYIVRIHSLSIDHVVKIIKTY